MVLWIEAQTMSYAISYPGINSPKFWCKWCATIHLCKLIKLDPKSIYFPAKITKSGGVWCQDGVRRWSANTLIHGVTQQTGPPARPTPLLETRLAAQTNSTPLHHSVTWVTWITLSLTCHATLIYQLSNTLARLNAIIPAGTPRKLKDNSTKLNMH